LTLSLYMLGAAVYLYSYQKDREPIWFLLSALFLGMGAWTKNEGLTYAAVGSAVLVFSARSWRLAGIGIGLIAVFVVPWKAFSVSMSLANDMVDQTRWLGFGDHMGRLPTVAKAMWRSMTGGWVGLLWPALVISSALNWRRMLAAPARSCVVLFGVQFAIYVGVYLITPRDLTWHLTTSVDRVLLHLAPLALWLTGLNTYQLAGALSDRHTAVPARERESNTELAAVEGVR
jgi:hypothetical protein